MRNRYLSLCTATALAAVSMPALSQVTGSLHDERETHLGEVRQLTFGGENAEAPAPPGDVRSFGASLGTIPDYTGSPDNRPGMLLSGVRSGGPADQAGLQRGDRFERPITFGESSGAR